MYSAVIAEGNIICLHAAAVEKKIVTDYWKKIHVLKYGWLLTLLEIKYYHISNSLLYMVVYLKIMNESQLILKGF